MPAAASFEDLYQQATTCSSFSSSYHLPNHYMNMFLASDSAMQQQQHQHQHQQQHNNNTNSKCPAELPPPKSSLIGDKDQRHAHQNNQTIIKSSNTMVMDDNLTNKPHPQQKLVNQQLQSKKAPISSYNNQLQECRPLANNTDLSRSTKYQQAEKTLNQSFDNYNRVQNQIQNQYYFHDDEDNDLFNWQPHSYNNESKLANGFDIFDLDNVMILHDDIDLTDDLDHSHPPHFLTTCEMMMMTPPALQHSGLTETTYNINNNNTMQHYLTLEELKSARNSCWLCGCNWQQDHVSLDCPECGGYALTRPCPSCDGKCKQVWMRNIANTHDRHKASWLGQCTLNNNSNNSTSTSTTATSNQTITPESQVDNICVSVSRQGQITTTAAITGLDSATNTTPPTLTGASSHLVAARTTQPVVVKSSVGGGIQPSSSSCCSSQPSSAASSDSE